MDQNAVWTKMITVPRRHIVRVVELLCFSLFFVRSEEVRNVKSIMFDRWLREYRKSTTFSQVKS